MLAVLFAAVQTARAWLYIPLDLDTLTSKCDLLIEGQIVSSTQAADERVQVRVTHVYRGPAREGDTITIVVPSFYGKPSGNLNQSDPLAVGDTLFWFLTHTDGKPLPGGALSDPPDIWHPLVGGLKLVANGHVVEFSHHSGNPGPILAELEESFVKSGKQAAVADYRKTVEASLGVADQFKNDLAAAIAAKNSSALVDLLVQRVAATKGRPYGTDQLAADTAAALNTLHDYAELDAAIHVDNQDGGYGFQQGFATAEGVRFLLKRIADTDVPSGDRILDAQALPSAYMLRTSDGQVERPEHFLATLSRLAADNGRDAVLAATLVHVLDGWAASPILDQASRDDLAAAVAPLKSLRATVEDSTLKTEIDAFLRDAATASAR